MVQAIINIDTHTNQILNIVKAKFGLNDKSQAIEIMAEAYENEILEPKLRPEYKIRLNNILKEKHVSRKEMEKRLKNV